MKLCLISLGCDKNLVDSELMLGFLKDRNLELTEDQENADILIINTCCFILDAKNESVRAILDAAELKKENLKALIVTGCMAERYKEEIRKEIPEVDAVVGTAAFDRIGEVLDEVLKGQKPAVFEPLTRLPEMGVRRVHSALSCTGYLKIAEGCSKHCTYCIIPSLRGPYRSYPMDVLVKQAEELASDGVTELILVAQETTVYGTDLYGKKKLPTLLRKLCRIPGIRWIRLMYCYPEEITEELIQVFQKEKKLCRYLDLPIQHASDGILKRMGRRTDRADLERIVGRLREALPDIVLRTTLISGFPGETEEDHRELLAFVEKMRFDRLGVFPYSREEGTPAAVMENQVHPSTKKRRRNEIMRLQQKISEEKLKEKTGQVLTVLVEGFLPEDGIYAGRSFMDAPDVDGYVFFRSPRELMSGSFVKVKVTEASEYDLKGVLV